MKKLSIVLVAVAFGLSLFASSSFARVTLDGSAALATVPAERTQKIGAANDGVIKLNGNIGWKQGQDYVSGNRLKVWLTGATGAPNITFVGTWAAEGANSIPVSKYTSELDADGVATFNIQLSTISKAAATVLLKGAAAGTFPKLDVSNVTGENLVSINGAALTSGLGTIDTADVDPILQTVTQYAANAAGTAVSTIDVVGTDGKVFNPGANTVKANKYTALIESTNVFGGFAEIAPTFGATDVLEVVLSGTNAFQGVTTVAFGNSTQLKTVPTAVKPNGPWTSKFTAAAGMSPVVGGANIGRNGIDIDVPIQLISDKSTALKSRQIDVQMNLILNATGNGAVLSANFPNRIQFVENGAQYASNMFKRTASGNAAFFKFANQSSKNIPLEMKYFPGDNDTTNPASTGWVAYTGDGGNGIPANGQITISDAEAAADFGFAENSYDGQIIFRAKGSPSVITAMVNARNANGSFNAPMYQLDAAGEWKY